VTDDQSFSPWILKAVSLAEASYSTPATFVVAGDVHVLISEFQGVMLVTFRGTEPDDWADWARDLDAVPMDGGPLGLCHKGFLTGAQAALQHILDSRPVGVQVGLVGHSLGGALAICTAGLLKSRGILPQFCITFGAPAVSIGDSLSKLIEHIPGPRYHNGDDPVPLLPPFPYAQDRALTQIGSPALLPLDDHAILSYSGVLTKMIT